jgi:hypothetical protein
MGTKAKKGKKKLNLKKNNLGTIGGGAGGAASSNKESDHAILPDGSGIHPHMVLAVGPSIGGSKSFSPMMVVAVGPVSATSTNIFFNKPSAK